MTYAPITYPAPHSGRCPLTTGGDTGISVTTFTRIEREYHTDLTLTPLNHTLTLRFKGESSRNQFWLNRIILVRRKE